MWSKNHTYINNLNNKKYYMGKSIPSGRSDTLIELPTYDHDPDVKLGEDQILIL